MKKKREVQREDSDFEVQGTVIKGDWGATEKWLRLNQNDVV